MSESTPRFDVGAARREMLAYLRGPRYRPMRARELIARLKVPKSQRGPVLELVRQLQRWHFGIIDCQMATPLLASLGAREIPRREFSNRLKELVNYPRPMGPWRFDNVTAQ